MSNPPPRRRADLLLVERGLFESRARAQAAIAAGLVTADGATVGRASDTLSVEAAITAEPAHPYVSRGGVKLAFALDRFDIAVEGFEALDVGASTGGFTDVLLARGAVRVVAVDVGRGQLHPRIAADPRVTSREGVDIRDFAAADLPAAPGLVVIDVSFAPLSAVLPAAAMLAAPGAAIVALVKPQFEVGRKAIGKRGIVKDEAARLHALAAAWDLASGLGLVVLGDVPSPITGGDGNVEYLLAARKPHG
ncbi:TlyA family RNA methyltransferase [Hansschlegelia zhihuaiae]|uniref:TlyA family RNA methyltransferase n=1 Tax=Hansschlegelia zhihuaiae TaxID=405005 RepID=A0A4Q0MLU0_9HYPH|nr:TlyA family RNA methyltransferase [Hansschlegelia zhihuaiae]RXF74405.1 TlyA family RNA methyltransferase [Hansschlegelia zhihuaiae]